MKTLRALQFGANDVLTREQLKNVLGGTVKPPTECTNACGGSLGSCPSGQSCSSVACPDDPAFTHTICSASAA
ncbi:hypothetical protein FHS10_005520 [Mucilaginibacter dorajii]|nr:hypothetical protein [Mucilaginibacter dorajii]